MSNEKFFAVCVDRFNTGIPVYASFTTRPAAEQHAADMNKKVIAEQYCGSDKEWFNDKKSTCWVVVCETVLAAKFPQVAYEFARGTLQ